MGIKKFLRKKKFLKIGLVLSGCSIIVLLGAVILIQHNKINALNMNVNTKNAQIDNLQKNENPQSEEIQTRRKELLNQLNPQSNTSSGTSNTGLGQDCQKEQAKYNSCLTEYNTKLLEYQSCMQCKQNKGFGCDITCIQPYNNCSQDKPSSLCN